MPASVPDMGGAAPIAPVTDDSETGNPGERAEELAKKIQETSSDLVEVIGQLEGEQPELADVDQLNPDQVPEGVPPMAMASDDTTSLQSMRKFLNSALVEGMKEAVAELNEHKEELKLIAHISTQGKVSTASTSDKAAFTTLTKQAFSATANVLADSQKLLAAFCKYARGTEALEARAQAVPDLGKATPNKPYEDWAKKMEDMLGKDKKPAEAPKAPAAPVAPTATPANTTEVKPSVTPADPTKTASIDLTTKEGRAMYRAKLAQKGVEWSDMVKTFHPKGGTTTELDTKPEGDLAKVETITEIHDKVMEVATAPTPKVKKAADDIQRAVTAGKIAAADVDSLVAHGVDADAVKYWKSLYGQASDGGSEFASELLKDFGKTKSAEENQVYQIKLARSYELAYDMADRGLISRSSSDIKSQVEEIMNFNDASFESLKKVVARHPVQGMTKQASIPSVGMLGSDEVIMPSADESTGLQSELERAFSTKRY